MKRFRTWAVPVILALLFPALFYWEIFHYQPHMSDSFLIAFPIMIAAAVRFIIVAWRAAGKRAWGIVVFNALALACCLYFFYWIGRIPDCIECDGLWRKSDLGFMLEPFADRFGDLWLD